MRKKYGRGLLRRPLVLEIGLKCHHQLRTMGAIMVQQWAQHPVDQGLAVTVTAESKPGGLRRINGMP